MRQVVVTVATVALLSACATTPLTQVSSAAEHALECEGDPYNGGRIGYDSGLASAQASPAAALENVFDEEGLGAHVPVEGYHVEREDDGRVLFSYDVDGRTKVAFIAADDVRDYNDTRGWGIDSWAQCDPAELPSTVTEALGIGVWQDASGARVPVTQVRSFQGGEHCGWQDLTFLEVGPEADQYVRDVTGKLADSLVTTYDATAALPDSATDTGLRREGQQLWLDAEKKAAYLVSLDNPGNVERWPAAEQPIGCA